MPDWVVARGQHGAAGVGDDTHAIGGRAGGYINLFSSRMVLAGNITARGGSGLTPGAGGGAGGVVLLDAFHAVEGGGVVDARGGDGGDSGIGSGSGGGGGGGGGRVTVRARGKEGGPEAAAAVWDTSDGQTQPPLRVLRNGGLGGESGTADSGGGCGSVGVFQVYHGSGKVDVPWVPWVSVAADTLVEGDSAKVCDYSNRNPAATPHVLGCYGLDAHVTVVGTPVRLDPSDAMCNTAVGERTTTVMAATLLSALHARSSSDAPMVNASVVAQQVTLGAGARAEVVVLAPHDASAPASYTSVMAADRVSVQEDAELVVTAGGALLTAWFHNKGTVHTTGADFGVDAAPFTTKDGRPPALIAASANMTHGEGSVVNASSSNLHLHGNTTVLFTAGVVRSATGLHVSAVGSVVWESCDVTGHGVVVEASSASAASGGAGIVLRDTTVRLTAPGNWTAAGLELTHSLIEVAPGLFSTPATSLGRRLASSSSSSSSDSNGTCHWSFTHDGVVLRVGQKDGVSSELRVINGMSLVLADTSLVAETDAMVSLRNGAHLAARAIRVSGSLHVGDDDTAAPSEVVLSATGSLRFLDGSTTAVNATAVFQADGILVAGAVVGGHSARFEAYSALTISSSGSLQLHARHCVLTTAKGTIAINGMASLGAHAIISAPALTVVGSLALASSGKVNIRGDVVVEGSLTFASSGAVMSTGGDVTVNDGGSLMMESDGGITSYRAGFFGGGITLLGDVSLGSRGTLFTAGGDVSVKDSGVLVMGADGNMTSSRVSSSSLGGGIDVVGSVSLSSGGTVASLTGVKVWNSGSLSLGSGGRVISSDGGLEVAGHISLAPDGVVSTTGGGISVLSDGTLTMELDGHVMSLVSGSIGGTIDVSGNMSLAAGGRVETTGGNITVLESGIVSMQSAGTVWCDGHILVEGTVFMSSQGAVRASGGDISVMQNGTLTLDSDGAVAAHRRSFFGGGITLLGGMSLGPRGTLLTAGGDVAVKSSGILVMGVHGNMTSFRAPSASTGGGIDVEGSVSLATAGTVASLSGVKVWRQGRLSLGSRGHVTSSDGGLEVLGHMSVASAGTVSTTGGSISVLSDAMFALGEDGHVMSHVSGSVGGTIDVDGRMSLAAGGRVEATGGNVTVLESGVVSMQSAGTVWCDGHVAIEGTMSLSSQGAVTASGGDVSVMQNGSLTLDSDGVVAAHRRGFFGGGITLFGNMSLGSRGTLLTAGGDVAVKAGGALVMEVDGNVTSSLVPSSSKGGGIGIEGSVSLSAGGTVASLRGVKVWRQGRLSLGSRGHVTSSDGGLEVVGHMSVASNGTVSTTGGGIVVAKGGMLVLDEAGVVVVEYDGTGMQVVGTMSLGINGTVRMREGASAVVEGHTSLLSLASGSSMELVGSDDGGNSAGGLTVCDGGTLALATHVSILADALQLCQLGRITPLLAPSSVHAMPTSPAAHTGTATTVAVRVSTFTLGPNTTAVFVPGAAIVAAEAITLQPGATLSALSHVRAVACPGVTALNGQCTAAVARAGGSHASLGGGEPTLVVTNHTRTVPVDLATVSTPTPSSLQAPFSLSEAEVVARDATAWTLGGAAQANETEWDTVSQAAATTASSSSSWDTVYPLPPGTGGGVLRVVAPSVQVDTGSAIHVDGRGGAHVPSLLASGGVPPTSITAPGDWGGGAGGTVVVVCAHLVGDGRVSANGGNGGGWGGGGAGGHVVVRAGNMTAWDSEAQARAGASELCVFLFFVAFLFVWALLSFVVSHVRCRWFVRLLSCLVLSCFVGRDGVNVGCGAVT